MKPHTCYLAIFLAFASTIATTSCKSTSNQPKVGFVGKNYYLSAAEKKLSVSQLRSRISSEAAVAADLRAQETQRAVGRTAAAVGIGLVTGHYNINPVQDAPAARAKIKMRAYSDRIVELGGKRVNVDAVMDKAIANHRTSRQ